MDILPCEIIIKILRYLSAKDVLSVGSVNKYLKKNTDIDILWRKLTTRRFGEIYKLHDSWKDTYIRANKYVYVFVNAYVNDHSNDYDEEMISTYYDLNRAIQEICLYYVEYYIDHDIEHDYIENNDYKVTTFNKIFIDENPEIKKEQLENLIKSVNCSRREDRIINLKSTDIGIIYLKRLFKYFIECLADPEKNRLNSNINVRLNYFSRRKLSIVRERINYKISSFDDV